MFTLCFHSLIVETSSYKLYYIPLQIQPIVISLHCCECLLITWVTRIRFRMKFPQDHLLEFTAIWYIYVVSKPNQYLWYKIIVHALYTCTCTYIATYTCTYISTCTCTATCVCTCTCTYTITLLQPMHNLHIPDILLTCLQDPIL